MNEGAHVESVEDLDAFRTELSQFIKRTVQALDEVGDRVRRTRLWIENDRFAFWNRECKKRARRLEQTEQELHQVRIAGNRGMEVQQMMVRKARRALQESEEKVRIIDKWMRDFDAIMGPLIRPVDRLRDQIAQQLPKGVGELLRVADTLDAYRNNGGDFEKHTLPPADQPAPPPDGHEPTAPPPP